MQRVPWEAVVLAAARVVAGKAVGMAEAEKAVDEARIPRSKRIPNRIRRYNPHWK